MQHIGDIDKKMIEEITILRGDPTNTFIVALDVKGIDKKKMIWGLELAKLDYEKVEAGWEDIRMEKEEILSQIQSLSKRAKPETIKPYSRVAKVPEYIARIDNDFIAIILKSIKEDEKKQGYKEILKNINKA